MLVVRFQQRHLIRSGSSVKGNILDKVKCVLFTAVLTKIVIVFSFSYLKLGNREIWIHEQEIDQEVGFSAMVKLNYVERIQQWLNTFTINGIQ